jgi:hypothetical protein
MLEHHQFCDSCPGCRPAIVDSKTGTILPPESPIMVAVNDLWDHHTTYEERKAFIEVTLHNSQAPPELQLAYALMQKIQTTITNMQ